MRVLFVIVATVWLGACATQANVGIGAEGGGRTSSGAVRVGVPF